MNIQQWNAVVDVTNSERLMTKTKERGGNLDFVQPEPKPGSRRPFKRANELWQKIVDTHAQFNSQPHLVQEKLHELPPYVSRGHGWKGRIKNRQIGGQWSQDRSKYQPHVGKKELDKAAYRALPAHMREEANRISKQVFSELEVGL